MPLCSLYLISLSPLTQLKTLIPKVLSQTPSDEPIFIARPLRWMIHPWITDPNDTEASNVSDLGDTKWDLVLIYPSIVNLSIEGAHKTYTLQAGISSKIIANLSTLNKELLDSNTPKPELTGGLDRESSATSTKDLELTSDLKSWIASPDALKTPPSMLNFLSINPGTLDSYKAYGKAFATDVGKRRGGLAKIVGTVVEEKDKVWDEIAVAHYPSVLHFADMIMGEDYQRANKEHRVGALKGTGILCCDELDGEVLEGLKAAGQFKAKI